ncbi:MAG TPA: helix-turn-helix transcriptional regulator [Clostridiales bacterium]|nr:helix-turn-helix transcriptional regulator [Clostridiales bacterium]
MSVSKKIKLLLVEREMTMTELAEKLNTGKSNLSGKMKRDNFSENDLKKIAEVLNCDYDIVFTMKDSGKQI